MRIPGIKIIQTHIPFGSDAWIYSMRLHGNCLGSATTTIVEMQDFGHNEKEILDAKC